MYLNIKHRITAMQKPTSVRTWYFCCFHYNDCVKNMPSIQLQMTRDETLEVFVNVTKPSSFPWVSMGVHRRCEAYTDIANHLLTLWLQPLEVSSQNDSLCVCLLSYLTSPRWQDKLCIVCGLNASNVVPIFPFVT